MSSPSDGTMPSSVNFGLNSLIAWLFINYDKQT